MAPRDVSNFVRDHVGDLGGEARFAADEYREPFVYGYSHRVHPLGLKRKQSELYHGYADAPTEGEQVADPDGTSARQDRHSNVGRFKPASEDVRGGCRRGEKALGYGYPE